MGPPLSDWTHFGLLSSVCVSASMNGCIKYFVLCHVLTSFNLGHWESHKIISPLLIVTMDEPLGGPLTGHGDLARHEQAPDF